MSNADLNKPQLKDELLAQVNLNALPMHIGIIMDGNGRWAKSRNLPIKEGHRNGVEALRKVLAQGEDLGIPTLTVFAFSTENWKRSQEEVGFLMNLILEYLQLELKNLHKRGVKINILGRMAELPKEVRLKLQDAIKLTANNTKFTLNVAVNYGARMEIVDAVKKLVEEVSQGSLKPVDITENMLSTNLYTAEQKDPDLLIRPSGEYRLSNFLLWQGAYAELYFTPVLWPDFDDIELLKAVLEYQRRQRRFGGR